MSASAGRLDAALRAAGLTFDGVSAYSQTPPANSFLVTCSGGTQAYITGLPSAQQGQAQTVASTFVWGDRVPRALSAILADLLRLTTAQQQAIWSDLTSGTPPKWQGSQDRCVWAIAAMIAAGVAVSASGKAAAVACYTQENPTYLVQPAFAPTINVPGDQAA